MNYYYGLPLVANVCGTIVPALVGLRLVDGPDSSWIFRITFILSLLVAASIAVEEFFHYGEHWRHYRRIVETLKSEGWQFFQLAGKYHTYAGMEKPAPPLPSGWRIFFTMTWRCS